VRGVTWLESINDRLKTQGDILNVKRVTPRNSGHNRNGTQRNCLILF
jgi:hypothetical protein